MANGELCASVKNEDKEENIIIRFHPDGLILGIGTSAGNIHIYEAKTQKRAATFTKGCYDWRTIVD